MKTDKYIVYCKKADFYLGDAIVRYLQGKNIKCDFWYDEIPDININENLKTYNFIAVINPELVNDSVSVSIIERATLSPLGKVFLLENEKIETFPETWGEAHYIDATKGLDKSITETISSEAKKPIGQIVNIRKEIEDLKKAEEARLEAERKIKEEEHRKAEEEARLKAEKDRKIFERSYLADNLNDKIVENIEVSPNVKKGLKYLLGDGFPKDEERAYKIFKKETEENPKDVLAAYYYALCIDFEFDDMKESEPELADKLMVESYKRASEGGIHEADLSLASYYISRNEPEVAINIYNNLILNNHPKSKYFKGLLAEQNRQYSQALDFYYEAAEDGIPEAQNAIGYMYGEGWGTTQDIDKALQWFRLASDAGQIQAKYNLALAYILSNNSKFLNEAYNILNELAENNHPKSLQLLNELRKEEEKERKRQQKKEENEMIKQQLINTGLNLFNNASSSLGLGKGLKNRGY